MEPNYDKLALSVGIESQYGTPTSDVCHNYGIISGCDVGCPALIDGDCRNVHDVLTSIDVDGYEATEIMMKYDLCDEEKTEIIKSIRQHLRG